MEGRTVSHYRILARLGGGGMGVVYKAEDTRLKRLVALKFLPPELTRDHDARERFVQEAQAASALDHPNICTIYEVGDEQASDQLFIAMTYYDGETLKARLTKGPLSVSQAVDIALQIARGLDNAHRARIVHRDIKPANVMLTSQGFAKIVDFGIAKLLDRTGPTRTGTTLGTVAYMAPEQIAGGPTDSRVDLWAVGVVLYEMLTGQRPFGGESEAAVIHNILGTEPAPLASVRPDVPPEVSRIVHRLLARSPDDRYASAEDLVRDLAQTQAPASTASMTVPVASRPVLSRRTLGLAALIAVLVAGGLSVWVARQRSTASRVDELIAGVSSLIDRDEYFAAFQQATEAARLVPGDARLDALWDRMSVRGGINTEPAGAMVSMRDYRDGDGPWTPVGRTPLEDVRLPRGGLRWRIELDGYDSREFIAPARSGSSPPLVLDPTGSIPDDMVPVRTAGLNLVLAGYDYTKRYPAANFVIDKFEVSNRKFQQFVAAGGYTKPEFWKYPFVKAGRPLSFDEAMAEFRDRTDRPGPSTWEVGTYPSGHDDHPVGGVSWYEAMAYAEFAGKSLPTAYHWVAAATTGAAAYITPLSNIGGSGPAPVGTFRGVTGLGIFDAAGNVREWSWNATPDGTARYHLGGSWEDPSYMFTFGDADDPFDRSPVNGFRLVQYLDGDPAPSLLAPIAPPVRGLSRKPPSDEVLDAYSALYRYDPAPLEPRVESTDESDERWTLEVVSYTATNGRDRWPAYLFLPKDSRPPYQAVVFAPGANAIAPVASAVVAGRPGFRSAFDYLMTSGRAVIFPVYDGTLERNTWQTSPWPDETRTRAFQDWMVQVTRDARRAVDYLTSRDDIDRDKLAYLGFSWGSLFAPRVLAFEPRLKTAVLLDGGAGSGTQIAAYAAVDSFNFAGRVKQPVLMVNASGDFIFPVDTAQNPLFEALGSPAGQKRHVIFPGGHGIISQQRSQVVREALNWLDTYLGPVSR